MPRSSESSRKSILLVIAVVCALPLIAEKPQETNRPKYDLSTESKMKAMVEEVKLPAKGSEKEFAGENWDRHIRRVPLPEDISGRYGREFQPRGRNRSHRITN
jgi:hypothetical protein